MNKKGLIEEISGKLNHSNRLVKDIIEETFLTITDKLSQGEAVRIVGFGEFEVRERASRLGRNPNTGEPLQLDATKTPAFAPGKSLLDRVKGRR